MRKWNICRVEKVGWRNCFESGAGQAPMIIGAIIAGFGDQQEQQHFMQEEPLLVLVNK